MNEYDEMIEAMTIFKKYPGYSWFSAEHDELRSGPDPDEVSEEDKARLAELGWNHYGDGGFMKFV